MSVAVNLLWSRNVTKHQSLCNNNGSEVTSGTLRFILLQMSQKENENDIWDYKPLSKKKKRHESPPKNAKRKCTFRKSSKKDASSLSIKPQDRNAKAKAAESEVSATAGITDDCNLSLNAQELNSKRSPTKETNQSDNAAAEGPSPEDFCPICQMPFFILVVQSQRWHVAECIDTPRDTCTGTDVHTHHTS